MTNEQNIMRREVHFPYEQLTIKFENEVILTLIKCRIMTIFYFARIWNIVPGLSPDQPSRVHVPALAAAVKVSRVMRMRMRMAGGQGRLETVADCGTERGQLPAEYKLNTYLN